VLLAPFGLARADPVDPPPFAGDAYADYLVSRYAEATNDPVVALQRYARSLEQNPAQPDTIARAIAIALGVGEVAAAAKISAGARAVGINEPWGRLCEAALALATNQRGHDVIELLGPEPDANQEPSLIAVHRTLHAAARARDHRLALALSVLKVEGDGETLAQLQRGLIYEAFNRGKDAAAAYRSIPVGAVGAREATLAAGAQLERRERQQEALALYRERDPKGRDPQIAAAAARAREAVNPPPPADAVKGAALVLTALSAALLSEDQPEAAGPVAALALALDSGATRAHLARAQSLIKNGQGEAAIRALAFVAASDPYYPTAQVETGRQHRAAGRLPAALAAMQLAYNARPDGRTTLALAEIHLAMGDHAKAEALLSQHIAAAEAEGDAKSWYVYFLRGAAFERLKRWPEAEADFNIALSVAPNQPEVLNALGYGWVDRGQNLEEGLALIRKALAARPSNSSFIDSLGWALFRLGRFEQAVEPLEVAASLAPGDVEINDHLGDVYWRLGRRSEARHQWRHAAALCKDPAQKKAIEAKIADGLPPP
jgi:Flp pilus assembly protein TadD